MQQCSACLTAEQQAAAATGALPAPLPATRGSNSRLVRFTLRQRLQADYVREVNVHGTLVDGRLPIRRQADDDDAAGRPQP
jgi:hypothetical protein